MPKLTPEVNIDAIMRELREKRITAGGGYFHGDKYELEDDDTVAYFVALANHMPAILDALAKLRRERDASQQECERLQRDLYAHECLLETSKQECEGLRARVGIYEDALRSIRNLALSGKAQTALAATPTDAAERLRSAEDIVMRAAYTAPAGAGVAGALSSAARKHLERWPGGKT